MPPTERQLRSCILLAYQLLTYFDNAKNPHQELQTPELTNDIIYITHTYDTPHLPKENPFPAGWLLRRELAKTIREFQRIGLLIPASKRFPPEAVLKRPISSDQHEARKHGRYPSQSGITQITCVSYDSCKALAKSLAAIIYFHR